MKTAKPSKGAKTRERILRTAERLFAEHGYDGVSARRIAASARVQLALLSYYFHSKLGLYRAVFQRRIEPISERRLEILHGVMRRAIRRPQSRKFSTHSRVLGSSCATSRAASTIPG